MMSWWTTLQPRERLILGAGGLAALLIIIWGFAWQPLTSGRDQLRASIDSKQQLLSNVSRASAFDSTGADTNANSQSLFVLIDQTAQAGELGSSITRARPDGPNTIDVTFSGASFDSLIAWLITLNQSNGVYVDGASINTGRQQGLVSGQLRLRRG